MKEEECCPKFNPKPWDGKVLEWEGKSPKCAKKYGKNYVVIISEIKR